MILGYLLNKARGADVASRVAANELLGALFDRANAGDLAARYDLAFAARQDILHPDANLTLRYWLVSALGELLRAIEGREGAPSIDEALAQFGGRPSAGKPQMTYSDMELRTAQIASAVKILEGAIGKAKAVDAVARRYSKTVVYDACKSAGEVSGVLFLAQDILEWLYEDCQRWSAGYSDELLELFGVTRQS